ncbi:TetR/AcrR family transcriptional regulator [Microbacterium terricola]|uniref:TetR/AcrR family transcriptional regulator n=1 Tax=Microbacterium terricola TaxID=344163 RepID=UPI0021E7E9A6|nr:TetR family transcriptional regulator C-terminal domain-containing protein [Microbacterium terricola]UYK40433.1 TetR family transcriptional regulator C-terminal domain-containing protein [Microbacterium terricola]
MRRSPAQRRAELSATARSIALDQGLAAITVRAVASGMGVAPGLVGHYTSSMDELVADTFAEIVAAELRDVAALAEAQDAAVARLRHVLDTLLDGSRDDITLVWVQAWALGVRNEALAARVREQMDAWQRMLEAEIVRGLEAGEFTVAGGPADAAAIAWHLLAMIDGLNAHSLVRWGQHPDRAALAKRSLAGLLGVDPAAFG